ncbi:MAG: DEAD/DEAH box helicase [Bacteroidetes bacterium]|nr:DEAD/DEAH box helicase [Bacteroidota bacterium]MCB0843364.1 DEAD/DEAH box helicase [Bacteroidota bacterium]MCB0850858.1 DEAD/DEAH box helicase [Bacteroidota bacterium]
MKFSELPLDYELLDGIDALNFETLTPIQEQAIPPALEGKDLIACAQTGTGKTAAYLIPVIQHLRQYEEADLTRVLIIAPTRELAKQIDQNVDALSYFTGVSSIPIIGGKNADTFEKQKYGITHGADILIATPGRLIIHLALGYLDMSHIDIVVLDEADKMLDMGFYADITRIISEIPADKPRQTLMFSATMPPKIRKLAKEIMKDPVEINLNISKPAEGINQMVYMVYDEQKIPLLEHLIREKEIESMIIFASSKASVDQIERKLKRLNYAVKAMHSDREQEEREETLREFKNKQFQILVGTDVLARGIDVDNLSHVLNYDAPRDAEDYVHRVGRTARASSTGEAITFVSPRDQRRLYSIEDLIGEEIFRPEPPNEIGDTPRYNPSKKSGKGGRDNSQSDNRNRNRNRNRKPSNKKSGSGNENRNRNRNRNNNNQSGNKEDKPVQHQNKAENGEAKNEKTAKKRRYRSRKKKPMDSKSED